MRSRFGVYMAYGAWHALAIFFIPFYALAAWPAAAQSGAPGDLAGAGTAVFFALVLVVTLKLCARTRNWNWITHLTYGLSLGLAWPFVYVLGVLWPKAGVYAVADMTGVAAALFASPAFWLATVALAPAVALLPDLAVAGFQRYLRPSIAVVLQEMEALERAAQARGKAGAGAGAGAAGLPWALGGALARRARSSDGGSGGGAAGDVELAAGGGGGSGGSGSGRRGVGRRSRSPVRVPSLSGRARGSPVLPGTASRL